MHELDRDLELNQEVTADAGSRDEVSHSSEDDGQSLVIFRGE